MRNPDATTVTSPGTPSGPGTPTSPGTRSGAGTPTSPGTPSGATRRTPSVAQATLLVAEREIVTTARTRSFQISTGILLLAVLASILASGFLAGRESTTTVAVADGLEQVDVGGVPLAEAEGLELVPLDGDPDDVLAEGGVSAVVVPDAGHPTGVRIIAETEAPGMLVALFTVEPEVELLEPPQVDDGARYLVAFGFGFVFLLSATGFGSMIAQNTVQEKQSRIVEILLATVPPRALLGGKIIGNSVLAVAQTAALAAVAVLGLAITGQTEMLSALGAPVVWFVGFFVVGFVLLAGIFAASASLVSRQEDVGSVMGPAMMLTMAPYFLVILLNGNPVAMTVLSYVPFSAPVAMPTRLFVGEAAWWEPLIALALLLVAAALVIALGAKIYERSLLRVGPRAKLREVLAGE